jgi:hypothetical protein
MPLLVLRNGRFKLLLSDITPRAHRVADDLDIELRHLAKRRFKHAKEKKDNMCMRIKRKRQYNHELTIYRTSFIVEAWNGKESDYLSWLRLAGMGGIASRVAFVND